MAWPKINKQKKIFKAKDTIKQHYKKQKKEKETVMVAFCEAKSTTSG